MRRSILLMRVIETLAVCLTLAVAIELDHEIENVPPYTIAPRRYQPIGHEKHVFALRRR